MLFTADEWPGGKNLATTPAIWRRMFEDDPEPELRPELRPLALRLAAGRLPRPAGRVPRPALPRPRQGRPDRPPGARRPRGPRLPQALAHAQAPGPGRRPLGAVPRGPGRRRLRRPRRRRGRGPGLRRVAREAEGVAGHQPPAPDPVPGRLRSRPARRWYDGDRPIRDRPSETPTDADPERRADPPAPELSILVPVYNEAGNVVELHAELDRVLRDFARGYELIFVDDGSTDGTAGAPGLDPGLRPRRTSGSRT